MRTRTLLKAAIGIAAIFWRIYVLFLAVMVLTMSFSLGAQNTRGDRAQSSEEHLKSLVHVSATEGSPTLPWLELRDGVRAYTGDDGGGAETLTVCPSAGSYKRWSSDVTATVPECAKVARGIPISISSNHIEALDPTNLPGAYIVFIRADDSTWNGWTGSIIGIIPRIPLHIKVMFTPLVQGGMMMLFPNKISPTGAISFQSETVFEILGQDPLSQGPDLYGKVVSGPVGIGIKGWFHSLGLRVVGDGPLLFRPKS